MDNPQPESGSRVAGGALPERVGPKRVFNRAMLSIAVGFLVLARAKGHYGVGAAGLLFGIGQGYAFPILMGLVVARADGRATADAAISVFWVKANVWGSESTNTFFSLRAGRNAILVFVSRAPLA